jgi:hypothetical protein
MGRVLVYYESSILLYILVAQIPPLDIHNILNRCVRNDAHRAEHMIQSRFWSSIAVLRIRRDGLHLVRRLPPHLRLSLYPAHVRELDEADGGILRVRSADVRQSFARIPRLPVRPHLVDEAVVHHEERVTGGGDGVAVLGIDGLAEFDGENGRNLSILPSWPMQCDL